MTTMRQRQKSVLCHNSLLKKVTEGQMKGRKKPGRPGDMLLDWLMKKYKMYYSQLRGWQKTELNGIDKHRICPVTEYHKMKNRTQ